jgi:hypothetical protein
MQPYFCVTCGTGFPPSEAPPVHCPICEDERQYLGASGQKWTTQAELWQAHQSDIRELEQGLLGVGATPNIAIGQRALVVDQPGGGVMWDCIPLVTDEAVSRIRAQGGLRAIAISHPHFFTAMNEWSAALGDVPIHLHADLRRHVINQGPNVRYWQGESFDLGQGITLVRGGGHYTGSTFMHWADGAAGKGAIFTADTIMVVPDTRWVSFMYSYPNLIPLPAREVRRIAATTEPFAFDRIYSAWWDRVLMHDAKARLAASVERYVKAIEG